SSVQGMGEEYGTWEKGISCYCLDDQAYALDSLREYWFDIACIRKKDLEKMQVTIFEGYKIGMGSDWEDIATCERTLAELYAFELMMYILELWELKAREEITDKEYENKLKQNELTPKNIKKL